jgi:hypothetical protein
MACVGKYDSSSRGRLMADAMDREGVRVLVNWRRLRRASASCFAMLRLSTSASRCDCGCEVVIDGDWRTRARRCDRGDGIDKTNGGKGAASWERGWPTSCT